MKNLLETSLTPENDLQDLWELSGRVKAVLAWIESASYIDKDVLAAMLGGQVQAADSPKWLVKAQEAEAESDDGEEKQAL